MTLIGAFQGLKLFREIADADSGNEGWDGDRQWKGAYFFQPASARWFAYMVPIAPMPMRPIVGWSWIGVLGERTDIVGKRTLAEMVEICWTHQ